MKTLLTTEKLLETLRSQYCYFGDEKSNKIPVRHFEIIFIFKYGGFLEGWNKSIKKNKLKLQNVDGFEYVFPLS